MECHVEMRVPANVNLRDFTIIFHGKLASEHVMVMEGFESETDWITFRTLTIKGEYGELYLQKIIAYNEIKVTLENGFVRMLDIDSDSVTLISLQGFVDFTTPRREVNALITQPYGAICLAGDQVNDLDQTAGCPTDEDLAEDLPIIHGELDLTSECTVQVAVCGGELTCPTTTEDFSDTAMNLVISLQDGPVQVCLNSVELSTLKAEQRNPKFKSFGFIRSILNFNIFSRKVFSDLDDAVSASPDSDIFSIFKVSDPSYYGYWIYSTRKSYIFARPWLLSILSASLLKPEILKIKIQVIDNQCPARLESTLKNGEIWEQLLGYLYQTSTSLIAYQQKPNEIISFLKSVKGEYETPTQNVFSEGGIIFSCLILSAVLGIYGAIMSFLILKKLLRLVAKRYNAFIEQQISLTKVKHLVSASEKTSAASKKGFKEKQMIVGLCSLKPKNKSEIKKSQAEIKNKKQDDSDTNMGFFKLPALYVDHIMRKRTNSLKMFMNTIVVSPFHFPKSQFSSFEDKKENISIPVRDLQNKYEEFCTKYGFTSKMIEECESTLNTFNLSLEWRHDITTKALTFIRYKRPSEKQIIVVNTTYISFSIISPLILH